MANRYWVGGSGTWNTTSTTNWSASSGGSGGASVPTAADSVFFDQAGTYTVTMTGALNCLDITVSAGSVTFATGTTPTLSVAGSMAITAGTTTWSSTGTITFTATTSKTITSGGTVFDCSMTLNGAAGTWTLQDNLTLGTSATNRTFTVTQGTMALGSYTLTTHLFSSNNSNTRTLSFGTGKITTKASTTSTVFTVNTITGLTVTGSRTVEVTGGGGSGVTKTITVAGTATTGNESTAFDFVLKDTGGTVIDFGGGISSPGVRSLEFRAGSGGQSVTFSGGGTLRFYGSMIYDSTTGATSVTFPATGWQAAASSGSWTIDLNGLGTISVALTFGDSRNAAGGTWTLASNLTLANTLLTTHQNGTPALGSYTLSTGRFQSSSAQTRSFDFGTGQLRLTATTTSTVYTTNTGSLTVVGTPTVVFSGGGSAQTFTFSVGTQTEANAVNITLSPSSGTVTFGSGNVIKNLTLSNNVFTLTNVSITIVGNLLIEGTNPILAGGANTMVFAGSSGTKTITTNGEALDFPINFNGTGSTFQIVGSLTMSPTSKQINFLNGTVDFNNQSLLGGYTFAKGSGTSTIKNLTTSVAMPVTGGTLILGSNVTTGAFSISGGTIQLDTYTYTTSAVTWSGPNAKVMNFGTSGKFRIVSSVTGTIVTGTVTAFTVLGTTPLIECTGGGTGVTKTIAMGAMTEPTSIGVSILETSGTVTYAFTNPIFRDFKIDSVTGTTIPNIAATIYGNYTYSTVNGNATITGGTNAWTFAATSGTDTISTGGYTHDMPFTFNGAGGTWVLQSALTIGSGRLMTLTNGTLDLNGFTCTVGTFTTGAGTKNITFDIGTLTVVGSGASAFNNVNPTNFTTTAGTGVGTISLTSASAKTFVGGGSNYAAKLNQGGAGVLTISGSNTLNNIDNGYSGVGATTIRITSGTTQTLSNFTAKGSLGKILTLDSSSAGAAATLSKSSGTVDVDYLSIRDSTATGGATWYAGANSTNVSNNTGWIFSAAPVTSSGGAFFMMF